jgi:hypothetical protein
MIKSILSLSAGVAMALTVSVAPATGDVTGASQITCEVQRMAGCHADGECEWKSASARQKAELLQVNFESGEAFFSRAGKARRFGYLVKNEKAGNFRRFHIARKQNETDIKRMMVMQLRVDGALTGSRGRSKFEAMCKAG